MIKKFFIASFIILFLSNCSSFLQSNKTHKTYRSFEEYQVAISDITDWEIQGKIALIQNNKRQSANIFWQYNENSETQSLNLTTYLGINLFNLHAEDEQYTLNVDGKTYQTKDIHILIHELTGYQLPIQALSYWLKGLPYNKQDTVKVDPLTFLPLTISSYYDGALWNIHYQKYTTVSDEQLPTQLLIRQNTFTLKIMIHQWTRL